MSNFTEQSKSRDDSPRNKRTRALSLFDLVFLVCIAALLIWGVNLTSTPSGRPTPLAPSFVFGTAASILVYYFLGGLKQDETNSISVNLGIGSAKMVGSFGALVATTTIFNVILETQMRNVTLRVDPENHKELLVLNREANLEKIEIHGKDLGVLVKNIIINDKQNLEVIKRAEAIKKQCLDGKGFCVEELNKAKFTVNPQLIDGYASLCTQQRDFDGYSLQISTPKSQQFRVIAFSDRDCNPAEGVIKPLSIVVGQKHGRDLNITSGSEGWYMIPPFKANRPLKRVYRQ